MSLFRLPTVQSSPPRPALRADLSPEGPGEEEMELES